MSGLRNTALCLLLVFYAMSTVAQTPQELLLQRMDGAISSLWESIEINPEDEAKWQQLARMVDQRRVFLTTRGQTPEEGSRPTTADGVYREWIRRSPEDPRPFLALAMLPGDNSRRGEVLKEAWQRFPDRAEVARAWATHLSSGGDDQAATEVLEGMLERFPEDRSVWRFAVSHHRQQSNDVMVESLVQDWLTAIPGDGLGLSTWLDLHLRRAEADDAREFAAEALNRMRVDQDGIELCDQLSRVRGGELRDLGKTCFEKVARETADSIVKQRAERELREIEVSMSPGASRVQVLVNENPSPKGLLVTGMKLAQRKQCEDAVAVLDHLESFDEEHTSVTSGVSRALLHCWEEEVAQVAMLRVLELAPAKELSLVLKDWVRALPREEVEARLLRRLGQAESRAPIHQALDLLFAAASNPEAREANLRKWIGIDPAYRRDKKYEILADLLIEQGRIEESTGIVKMAIDNSDIPRWSLTERLVQIHLSSGSTEKAIEEAEAFLVSSSPKYHHWAYRSLARFEASRENLETAEEHGRAYFEAGGTDMEMETLYVALLCERGGLSEAIEFLASRHESRSRKRPMGSVEQYIAERLAGAGQFEAALDYLVRALGRAPERAELYRRIGKLTVVLGFEAEAKGVFDELVRLQPRSFESWFRLAVYHYAKGEFEESAEVIKASREYLGEDSRPDRFLVEIRLAQGDVEEAKRLLKGLIDGSPGDEGLQKELDWLSQQSQSSSPD